MELGAFESLVALAVAIRTHSLAHDFGPDGCFEPCLGRNFGYFTRPLRFRQRNRFAFSAASSGGDAESDRVGTVGRKGRERDLSEIKLKKGEPIDRALRRLKKKVDRENTLREVRNKRHYEKPSERRRRKLKVARFSAMLAARYADQ